MKKRNFLLLTLGAALLCAQANSNAMTPIIGEQVVIPTLPGLPGTNQELKPGMVPPPPPPGPGMTPPPPPLPPSIIVDIDNRVKAVEEMIQKANEKLDVLLALEKERENHFRNTRK